MIKVLILEDEIPARTKLKRFLIELDATIEIVAEIDTVEAAIELLCNTNVDLVFSDIELRDGNAFEIYNKIPVNCPIIFTTAYDQFWMNAFESNGIDYLLKPFSKERFKKSWNKFLLLRNTNNHENILLNKLQHFLEGNMPATQYKKRFTVNARLGTYFLEIENITFFEATNGVVFAFDHLGKKHLLNETTLKEIEVQLNPSGFFRINRSELVSKKYIEKIERISKNVLALKLKSCAKLLNASQSNTASFKEWIEK